jgi:hypothetical protein
LVGKQLQLVEQDERDYFDAATGGLVQRVDSTKGDPPNVGAIPLLSHPCGSQGINSRRVKAFGVLHRERSYTTCKSTTRFMDSRSRTRLPAG